MIVLFLIVAAVISCVLYVDITLLPKNSIVMVPKVSSTNFHCYDTNQLQKKCA